MLGRLRQVATTIVHRARRGDSIGASENSVPPAGDHSMEQQLHEQGLQINHLLVHLHGMDMAAKELREEVAELDAQLGRRVPRLAALEEDLVRVSASIRWLARQQRHHSGPPARPDHVTPIVSVVLPTHDRGDLLPEAIRSVQAQTFGDWELIVVDDGGTDHTPSVLEKFADDDRIRPLSQDHAGHAKARNRALAAARGSIITYLDSDDVWFPTYLQAVVDAYDDPSVDTAYGAQLVVDDRDRRAFVLAEPFDRAALLDHNFIPLTAFSHRREVFDELGGFDETLSRLVDWDLILSYTEARPPAQLDVLAGEYRRGTWPRVSSDESVALAEQRIRRKHHRPRAPGCRVLYVSEFCPQISESYVLAEMAQARREGVDVAIWSERPPPCPAETDIPILTGSLTDAVHAHRPHVAHVHHLSLARRYLPDLESAGVPVTVRAHGFEFDPAGAAAVIEHPSVRSVYLFPHLIRRVAPTRGRVVELPVAFDPGRYRPAGPKDRRLVVRASLGAPTKDLPRFIRVAARCPDHRFVLVVAWSVTYPDHVDELRAENQALGNPVEILVDQPHDRVVPLVQQAGIYLHTHSLEEPYGMPVSIGEAMGTGAYVVARRCVEAEGYVGDAGAFYDTDDEAVDLVRQTSSWSPERWRSAEIASIEHAHRRYSSGVVLPVLFDDWMTIAQG